MTIQTGSNSANIAGLTAKRESPAKRIAYLFTSFPLLSETPYQRELRTLSNMPVELEITYDDGTMERIDLPVDVWRNNEIMFTKGFFSSRARARVVLDPDESFADIDQSENVWTASGAER